MYGVYIKSGYSGVFVINKRTRMKLLCGQFNDPISIWGARPVEKVSKTLNARMVQRKLFRWMCFSYGGLISTYWSIFLHFKLSLLIECKAWSQILNIRLLWSGFHVTCYLTIKLPTPNKLNEPFFSLT